MGEVYLKRNKDYRPYFDSEARHVCLWGGRGSGKSVSAAQKHVLRALEAKERILTVRKVQKTCRHSTFVEYQKVLAGLGIKASINRTEMMITLPNGSEIVHAGMKDKEEFEKLLSFSEPTSIWMEEADQFTEDDFEEADVLMRGLAPSYFQTTLTFNPRRGKFWARRRFIEAPNHGGAFVMKSTWRNNHFLDAGYGPRLAAIPDANKRAIYEAGEWGQDVRGLVYPSYGTCPAPTHPPAAYGLDLGFVHPTALVAVWDADPELIVQQVVYASGMSTPSLIAAMQEEGVDHDIPLYCPPEQPGVINELVGAGYNALPANNKVDDGIATVKRYQLVFTDDSVDLMDEADEYVWTETRDGRMTQRPVKLGDDGMDAMRYAIHTYAGIPEPEWGMWS